MENQEQAKAVERGQPWTTTFQPQTVAEVEMHLSNLIGLVRAQMDPLIVVAERERPMSQEVARAKALVRTKLDEAEMWLSQACRVRTRQLFVTGEGGL